MTDGDDVRDAPGRVRGPWLAAADQVPAGRPEEALGWPRRAFLGSVLVALGLVFLGVVLCLEAARPWVAAGVWAAATASGGLLWPACVPLPIRPALSRRSPRPWVVAAVVVVTLLLLWSVRALGRPGGPGVVEGMCTGVMLGNVATILWIRLRHRAARRG